MDVNTALVRPSATEVPSATSANPLTPIYRDAGVRNSVLPSVSVAPFDNSTGTDPGQSFVRPTAESDDVIIIDSDDD